MTDNPERAPAGPVPIRVLIVDDSVVIRRALADSLNTHDRVHVVATAVDGQVALRKIADLTPDVVVLDIEMPVMDGMETLVAIRARWPEIAVIMFSTLTEHNASVSLEALALGAVDYATKPTRLANRQAADEHVREHVLPLVLLWGDRSAGRGPAAPATTQATPSTSYRTAGYGVRRDMVVSGDAGDPRPAAGPLWSNYPTVDLVVIGSSTGGPDALARLLPRLPAELSVPIVIVQHMPPVFTAMLAKRLDTSCALSVSETVDGEEVRAGHVYIAAGGVHVEVHRDNQVLRVRHTDGPRENSCKPAVDVMFRTAAAATRGKLLGVVLTGMGQDGLLGSQSVVAAGGSVIAQDEATSVVWGMPGFVARSGIAAAVLPLPRIAEPLSRVRCGVAPVGATT